MSDEQPTSLDDDYYSFLNVDKTATQDDITRAYRRLSRLFHPDKHGGSDELKTAETLFTKAQKAYEVLSDPHKRAIYDALGTRGLESEAWAVISRTKTPQEIREEFERLQKEKENYLRAMTSPRGVVAVKINAIELFDNYSNSVIPNVEVNSLSVHQSIDVPLTSGNTGILGATLNVDRGTGTGSVSAGVRRVFSEKTWGELQYGVGQGPVLSFKLFRRIFRRSFFSVNGFAHVAHHDLVPGFEVVLGKHLTRNAVGTITWKPFPQSFMNTSLAWNSNENHVEAQAQLGIPMCFAKLTYRRRLQVNSSRIRASLMVGTLGSSLEYGCVTKVSEHVVVGASMEVGVPGGVTLKIKLNRANQAYVFSILLAEEIIPSAVFYGTVVPLVSYYCLKTLIIDPYKKHEDEKQFKKSQLENASKLAKLKQEALAAVALMTETYHRILSQETDSSGLIIVEALYGDATLIDDGVDGGDLGDRSQIVDVKIPLQCLVKDSNLTLTSQSKASLPGIYDPCFGKEKKLYIKYTFRGKLHRTVVNDVDSVRLPNREHLL